MPLGPISQPPTAGDLRREDVEVIFRELLGRPATSGDVDVWMQVGSLRVFIDGVLASEEYQARMSRRRAGEASRSRGSFLNCWIAGWERYARPAGDVSPDGVAMVGKAGHLFIYAGANDNVATYLGETGMPDGWLQRWGELLAARSAQAREHGRRLACLVVPEKLAVYSDRYPEALVAVGPRPIERLLDAGSALVYPLDALLAARAGGETYLLTDSHLTPRGNRVLASATLAALGVEPSLLPADACVEEPVLRSGDLGAHFDPPLLELVRPLAERSRAEISADNWPEIASVGAHIGTVRVFRRDDAADARTVVVFGDSYGFGDEAYPGLSWWLAHVFREVHFVWTPFGWDPGYLDDVDAELVVCQTAERFVARVPQASIDVRSLATETLARRRAVTEERVFDDRVNTGGSAPG